MNIAPRWGWIAGQLGWVGLAGGLIYGLVAGGTYNGEVLFTLQRTNFVLLAVIGVAWLVWRALRRRPFPTTLLDGWLAAWLAVCLATGLFSSQPRLSLESFASQLGYVLSFYLVVDLARAGWSAGEWRRALLWSSLVVLALGLYELGRWYAGWLAIGGWQDPIPPATTRVRASLGHPNIAAAYLNLMLPLGLSLALRRGWRHWLALAWAGVALLLLYATSSRGGWLGTATALAALAVLLSLDHPDELRARWNELRRRRWLWAPLALAALALLAAGGLLLARQAQHPSHPQGNARSYIWLVALDMFRQHPLTGGGPGTFGLAFLEHYSIPPGMLLAHAHNLAFNTLAEMGLLGGLALAGLVWGAALSAWRAWGGQPRGQRLLTAALIASLAGLGVHSLFDTPETVPVISLLAVVLLGLLAAQAGPPRRPLAAGRARAAAWLPGLGLVAALALGTFSLSGYTVFAQGLQAARVGDWPAAADWLDEAAHRDPGLAFYTLQDGLAHGMLALDASGAVRDPGELQLAQVTLERALSQDDSYALTWANLGWLRQQAGDPAGALDAYAKAMAGAEGSVDLRLIYGRALEEQGRTAEASGVYQATLLLEPALRTSAFFAATPLRQAVVAQAWPVQDELTAGWQALEAGEAGQAAGIFAAHTGLNQAEAFLGLGEALTQLGDFPAAERALRTAAFAGADEWAVARALVTLYTRSGDPAAAAQAQAQVADLETRDSLFGTGKLGQADYAWYIYHRESLPLELLPGLRVQGTRP